MTSDARMSVIAPPGKSLAGNENYWAILRIHTAPGRLNERDISFEVGSDPEVAADETLAVAEALVQFAIGLQSHHDNPTGVSADHSQWFIKSPFMVNCPTEDDNPTMRVKSDRSSVKFQAFKLSAGETAAGKVPALPKAHIQIPVGQETRDGSSPRDQKGPFGSNHHLPRIARLQLRGHQPSYAKAGIERAHASLRDGS